MIYRLEFAVAGELAASEKAAVDAAMRRALKDHPPSGRQFGAVRWTARTEADDEADVAAAEADAREMESLAHRVERLRKDMQYVFRCLADCRAMPP